MYWLYILISKSNLHDMCIYLLNYQNLNLVGWQMKLVPGTFSHRICMSQHKERLRQ